MKKSEQFWRNTYEKNIAKMMGICYRYVRNKQLAEDLAHDAFAKAIEKAGSFSGKGAFEAWLRQITVYEALQYLRRHDRDKMLHEGYSYLETVVTHSAKEMKQEYTEKELLQAIDKLPEHHKLVFNMYVVDGFTHNQIAESLNISPGTSKSHLSRARKSLQHQLSDNHKTRRKGLFAYISLGNSTDIDAMYRSAFKTYKLSCVNDFPFNDLDWGQISAPNISYFTTSTIVIAGSVAVVGSIAVLVALLSPLEKNTDILHETQVIQNAVMLDTITEHAVYVNPDGTSADSVKRPPVKPVVVKRKVVNRQTVLVKETINIIDSNYAE